MKRTIHIIIADDHPLFRTALISFLKDYPAISVLGEAGNGKELLALLTHKKPDIVLLDIDMPIMNGMETLEAIVKQFPAVKTIMLTMYSSESLMATYILKGANGFVTKGGNAETLIDTINGVHENQYYFKQNISMELMKELKKPGKTTIQGSLTSREIEVIHLICEGKSHKQIAGHLNIEVRTVDFHKSNIYKKTKTDSVAGIYYYALKHGIIASVLS